MTSTIKPLVFNIFVVHDATGKISHAHSSNLGMESFPLEPGQTIIDVTETYRDFREQYVVAGELVDRPVLDIDLDPEVLREELFPVQLPAGTVLHIDDDEVQAVQFNVEGEHVITATNGNYRDVRLFVNVLPNLQDIKDALRLKVLEILAITNWTQMPDSGLSTVKVQEFADYRLRVRKKSENEWGTEPLTTL
jgi:hypothetical protein